MKESVMWTRKLHELRDKNSRDLATQFRATIGLMETEDLKEVIERLIQSLEAEEPAVLSKVIMHQKLRAVVAHIDRVITTMSYERDHRFPGVDWGGDAAESPR